MKKMKVMVRAVAFAVVIGLLALLPVSEARGAEAGAVNRCHQYEPAFRYLAGVGWDPAKMSRIAWRESRCQARARSTTQDSGLLQINDVNIPYLRRVLGVKVTREWLMHPGNNMIAAMILYRYWDKATGNGYQPWGVRA